MFLNTHRRGTIKKRCCLYWGILLTPLFRYASYFIVLLSHCIYLKQKVQVTWEVPMPHFHLTLALSLFRYFSNAGKGRT